MPVKVLPLARAEGSRVVVLGMMVIGILAVGVGCTARERACVYGLYDAYEIERCSEKEV